MRYRKEHIQEHGTIQHRPIQQTYTRMKVIVQACSRPRQAAINKADVLQSSYVEEFPFQPPHWLIANSATLRAPEGPCNGDRGVSGSAVCVNCGRGPPMNSSTLNIELIQATFQSQPQQQLKKSCLKYHSFIFNTYILGSFFWNAVPIFFS